MISLSTVIISVILYILIISIIARVVDRAVLKNPNSKLVNNPFIYTLSLAVYCTSWTFFGSVGKASESGLLFLTTYLGATLMIIFWGSLVKRLIKVKESLHITSVVDFISARYDKSSSLAIVATLLVILSSIPYLALQLKSLLYTFKVLVGMNNVAPNPTFTDARVGYIISFIIAVFTIFFGMRKLDPTARHPGMIFILALESLFKLIVFIALGIFCCYYLNDGFFDVLSKLKYVVPEDYSFMGNDSGSVPTWITHMVLSASAVVFLPRQFHVAVIENTNSEFTESASWGFPLYLFLINLFVIPICIVGLSIGGLERADQFVLSIPVHYGFSELSLFVFLGGVAASAGMIMITTMTVSTIITNHIILPLFTSLKFKKFESMILQFRWIIGTCLIFTSMTYVLEVGEGVALVSMGMVAFAGVFQFSPLILGAVFWKKGNRTGAFYGLLFGSLIWAYTLFFPAFMHYSDWGIGVLENGPFGIDLLRPQSLFGLSGVDPLTHSVFWSIIFNVGTYISFSLILERSKTETIIADDFKSIMHTQQPIVTFVDSSNQSIILEGKIHIMNRYFNRYYNEFEAQVIVDDILQRLGFSQRKLISVIELFSLSQEFEKRITGIVGAPMAHKIIEQSNFLTKAEKDELYDFYSETLANSNISPKELYSKINYYREKEMLMENQYKELEKIIELRTNEIQEKNNELNISLEKLKIAQEQIVSREKMATIGLMSTGVAHEIKNPLNFIINGAKLMIMNLDKEKPDREEINSSVDLIVRYAERIDNIVSKMLALTERGSVQAANVNYKNFFFNIIKNEVANCEVTYQIAPLLDYQFDDVGEGLLNEESFLKVCSIIIDNSMYALSTCKKDTRKLSIKLYSVGDEIFLSFKDNGNGIPDDILKNIFEPFVTTKTGIHGAGLGLCIANDIIRAERGGIKIDTQLGEFTEVILFFKVV